MLAAISAVGCLALAGCGLGAPGSSAPKPSGRPSGVSPNEPLIAVLEPGGFGQVAAAHNRVAIVRSGRVAYQFARDWAGRHSRKK